MNKFITKLVVFLFILILYFGFNVILNIFFYTHTEIELDKSNVLIMGDSHPQLSLNPKLFYNAQNISQPAEPLVLTFWKLKYITNSYIPDTLIIGFSPHNLSAYNDFKFSNRKWMSTMFKRSYSIQNLESIDSDIEVNYIEYYRTVLKQIGFYPKKNHNNFIGSYKNTVSNNVSDWESAIKRHYFLNETELGISDISVNHLDSIVNLCNNKNITLVLTSNPVHKNYLENIPSTIINKHILLMHQYNDRLITIDRTKNIYPDSLFRNSDHLNDHGANRFSKEVIDYLKKIKHK